MQENKAIKLASLVDGDKQDMQECVSDLITNSKLDEPTAIIVAKAIRAKYLPKVAQQLGLEEQEVGELLDNNFNDLSQSNITQSNQNEYEDENSLNGSNNELVDEIDAPDDLNNVQATNNLDNIKVLVAQALNDPSFAEFVKIEDEFELDNIEDNDIYNENERLAQTQTKRSKNESDNKRGNQKMENKKPNTRSAQREKLIREAEELLNASKAGFEYNSKQQYNVDREYQKMSLEGSDGNSMKKDTDNFASAAGKAIVPTTNSAEDLLLRDDIEIFKFDSSPDGGLEYTLPKDMFDLEIPATNVDSDFQEFKVPTQLGKLSRKTTIAQHSGMSDHGDESMEDDMDMESMDSMDEDSGEDFSMDNAKEFNISLPSEGEDEGEDMDMGEESGSELAPSELLAAVDGFDDDSLNEFLTGLHEWADENGVDLSGKGGEEGMEGASEMDRESVASVLGPDFNLDHAEEVLYDQLTKSGVDPDEIAKLTLAQGIELAYKIVTSQTMVEDKRPLKEITLSEDEEETCEECGVPVSECDCDACQAKNNSKVTMSSSQYNTKLAQIEKTSQVREARIKTAYDIWTKLAILGVIPTEEVAENVESWIEEGLTVKSMINQGNIMLNTAQATMRRTKTASSDAPIFSNALATTPAFTSEITDRPAVLDLKAALRGVFTQPEIER